MSKHKSDCAVHNEPAMPAGPCDCGATAADKTLVERLRMFSRLHTNHFAHKTAATLSEAADRIEADAARIKWLVEVLGYADGYMEELDLGKTPDPLCIRHQLRATIERARRPA